ncbi:MAG: hypothetical protein VB089_15585, partial [Anaerolineaceae bacterium]|nr:hypothetical protein [Anaerolineaceae bacterium]
FMNFDITAVWIDAAYRVVDVKLAKRWHLSYTPPRPAQFVLECHTKRYNDFQSGDELFFTDAK